MSLLSGYTVYIFKKFIEGGTPIAPPELEKPGGCPRGWYSYRNRCYQFHGFASNENDYRLTWTDAQKKCQETEGGTLAVLHDYAYDSFLFAHMSGTSRAIWVGGEGKLGQWSWADNSPWVKYFFLIHSFC